MQEFADKRGVQALLEIAQVVTEELVAVEKMPEKRAGEIGLKVADALRRKYGGHPIYVPKGIALIVGERDREIYRKFDGANVFALSREYDLTERQIYSIIARVRDDDFRRRQMGLFNEGDDE